MAYCKNCGSVIYDDASFCSNCGTPVDNTQNTQQGTAPQQQTTQQPAATPIQTQGIGDTASIPLPSEKGLAWLSYVLWTPAFLVPLFVKKTSEYCKYHVKQGATLWAVSVVYLITKIILLAIINRIFPGGFFYHSTVYNIANLILWGGNIFLFVLAIIGIINGAMGKKKELPLISKIPWVGILLDKVYAGLNKQTPTFSN